MHLEESPNLEAPRGPPHIGGRSYLELQASSPGRRHEETERTLFRLPTWARETAFPSEHLVRSTARSAWATCMQWRRRACMSWTATCPGRTSAIPTAGRVLRNESPLRSRAKDPLCA